MPATRKTLRQAIGVTLGEVLVLTATDAGTTSTFADRVHLLDREDNAPSIVHRIALFSGGSPENLGHEARVVGYQKASSALAFQPPAPSAVRAGDELEIWSNWARWGGLGALHLLLNEAIAAVAQFTGEQVYSAEQSFDFSAPEVAIPAGWCELGGVDRRDSAGLWKPIPPSQLRVRDGLRTVELLSRGRRLANAGAVRLWGYTPASALVDDNDTTSVDREWLVQAVASALRLGQSWRSSDRAADERLANFWAGRALDLRRKVGATRPGLGIALPA